MWTCFLNHGPALKLRARRIRACRRFRGPLSGPLVEALGLVALGLLLAVPGKPKAGFIAAPFYFVSESPTSVAVGDFNGDGIPDLAVANYGSYDYPGGTVYILLGAGDGTFQAAHSYATGAGADFVAVGDFNGDGIPDLAVANYGSNRNPQGTVSVLLGNGDGTFQAAQSYAAGPGPKSVAVGDFNGDGYLDLAVAGYDDNGNSGVSILLGSGDGTFEVAYRFAVSSNPSCVAAGDFNGDGHLDLAVGDNNSDEVSVLLGLGDGAFHAPQNYTINGHANSLVVGDFDGDGIPDLAVAGSVVTILLGKADGTFHAAHSYAVDGGASSLVVGDFNGDGIPDLAVAGSVVTILFGKGNATFHGAQVYAPGGTTLAAADFNRDGHPDLVVTSQYTGTLSVLLGKADGSLQAAPIFAYAIATGGAPNSVAAGDFDGDGHLDLALTTEMFTEGGDFGSVSVLLGHGAATFQVGQSYFAPFGPRAVAVGDFNGDGHLDLAVASEASRFNEPGTVSIFLGNGDGTFQDALFYTVGDSPSSLAVGDFNGDGYLDLAVVNSAPYGGTPSLIIFLGNGDGTLQEALSYTDAGFYPQAVAVGDFDGDGHLDLVLAYGEVYDPAGPGSMSILLGNGDGTFRAGESYAVQPGPQSVAVGDFDGDGHLDVAVAGFNPMTSDSTVAILRGNGDGTFGAAQSYAAGFGASTVVAADFNRDGYPDLAVATIGGTVSIFLSNGDGTFTPAQSYAAGSPPGTGSSWVAVGDFNGDGYPDLAVASWPGVSLLINAADWGGSR